MLSARDYYQDRIDWLGHASFRIRGSAVVYIDPWKIEGSPHDGDIVLITHSHYDHLSLEDIDRVARPDAILVAPAADEDKLAGREAELLAPGENIDFGSAAVEAVHAYNTDKDFHPRSQWWLGYVIEMDGLRIYHSGDSDLIDEMAQIHCDIALLPVSGTYVMDAEQAAEAVGRIGPELAAPMHWGEIIGEPSDAERFAELAPCEVIIKQPTS